MKDAEKRISRVSRQINIMMLTKQIDIGRHIDKKSQSIEHQYMIISNRVDVLCISGASYI